MIMSVFRRTIVLRFARGQAAGKSGAAAAAGTRRTSSSRSHGRPPPPPNFGIPHGNNGSGSTSSLPPPYMYVPVLGLVALGGYTYQQCLDEVPYTKRKRLLATSPQMECQMGDEQYKQLLSLYQKQILPSDHRASITVKRVGERIAEAATVFAKQYNVPLSKNTPTYTVVRSDIPNAFVLPNNHIFVLTGLFQFAQTEDELAAVLGHEMAHNIARHAGEKMSSTIMTQLFARLLLIVDPSGLLFTLFMPAATLFRDLPHSREAEIEADHIGLFLASEACYDPRAASRVFSAMKAASEKGADSSSSGQPSKQQTKKSQMASAAPPPEFLSTHPSYDSRLSNFTKWMPNALERYDADGGFRCRHVRQSMERARHVAHLEATQNEKHANKKNHCNNNDIEYRW